MEKENREKERFIEYINYYLERADIEKIRIIFFFSKNLVE